MKKFHVDMIDVDVYVYVGEKEFNRYIRKTGGMKEFKEQIGEDFVVGVDFSGLTRGSVMWVNELEASVIYHELAHVHDHIMESLHAEDESEFKAYLSEYLHSVVMKWACDEKKKLDDKENNKDERRSSEDNTA